MRFLILLFVFLSVNIKAENRLILEHKNRLAHLNDSSEIVLQKAELAFLYNSIHLDSVGKYATEAFQLGQRLKYEKGIAKALDPLSFYHFEKGNPFLAYQYIQESIQFFSKLKIQEEIVRNKITLARYLSMESGEGPELMSLNAEIDKEILKIKDDSIRTSLEVYYGFLHLPKLNESQAQELFLKAEQNLQTNPKIDVEIMYQNNLNVFLLNTGKIDLEDFLQRMQALIVKSKEYFYHYLEAITHLNMALQIKEDSDRILYHFQNAREIAYKAGYESLEYASLSNIQGFLGHTNEDPNLKKEVQERMLEISNNRIQYNKQEGLNLKNLAGQNLEIQEKDLSLKGQQKWIIGLAILIVCIINAIGIVIYRYNEKKKVVKKLSIMNVELQKKNIRLEENDDFHKKMISMLSHDLRQPFSIILMLSDDILDNTSETDLKDIIKEIQNSAEISLQTMDGLLNWMKLQILRNQPADQIISLRQGLQHAIRFSDALRKSKNVSIDLNVEESIGVRALSEILLFINRNIILNAINHSPYNGRIEISAQVDHQQNKVLVKISDEGNGLPEHVLNTLFKKEAEIPADNRVGAGISMVISHEMIQSMGGTIWAENNPIKGASFCYSIPYSPYTKKEDV